MSFNNKGFIFLEIIISLIVLFTLLTIFVAVNSNLVGLLEKVELDKIFYLNSLNIGNELIIYFLDSSNLFFDLNKNYSILEIEENYYNFQCEIDQKIREEIAVKLSRVYSLEGYILYNLSINYADNEIIYLFFR
ncbi:MAG: hypothetical protein ABR596_07700 [Halarsenatibacteraceae bacterium]